jgi:hypothetical protein
MSAGFELQLLLAAKVSPITKAVLTQAERDRASPDEMIKRLCVALIHENARLSKLATDLFMTDPALPTYTDDCGKVWTNPTAQRLAEAARAQLIARERGE